VRAEPVQIFHEAYRELRPRAPIPEFGIEFFKFSNINNTIRLREGRILVRISDLLEGAPQPVLRAIAHILLAKLYRKQIAAGQAACYRKHIASRNIAAKSHLVRQMRGRKRISSALGHHFYGLLGRPQMTWSAIASRTNLGHFDPAHNTIVVSRIFDGAQVPRYAVEYLVYHEMLHLKYPVKLRGSRRCVHSTAFQAEEKQFQHFEEAKKFLARL